MSEAHDHVRDIRAHGHAYLNGKPRDTRKISAIAEGDDTDEESLLGSIGER